MDAATIAFAGALLVSFTGNMVQLAMKLMSKAEKVPLGITEEIKEWVEQWVEGRVYRHEAHCHIGEELLARLDATAKTTREDLQQYRKDLGDRLDRIEAQLTRHIEKD